MTATDSLSRLGWLLPVTYLAHFAEELWVGEGFPMWVARVVGRPLSVETFASLNTVAWLVVTIIVALATLLPAARVAIVAPAAAVFVNGLAHLGGTVFTGAYSPGLISGLVLWVPLGAIIVRRAWGLFPHGVVVSAIAGGVLLHGLVSLTALASLD